MRDGLKTFLLRLLFLYPLCLAAWWALAGIQIETIAALASGVLRFLVPNVQLSLETQWETISIAVQAVSGQTSVVIDPLVLTRGLPIYLALMLAAPMFHKKWRGALLGVLAILVAATLGFAGEAAVRIAQSVPSGIQTALVPADLVQIIAKSVATKVLPIGLWLWQQWAFLKRLIGESCLVG